MEAFERNDELIKRLTQDRDDWREAARKAVDVIQRVERERDALRLEVLALRFDCQALEARVDALMLEYCPDEMTPEQIAKYERHQRPVAHDEIMQAERALGGETLEAPKKTTGET